MDTSQGCQSHEMILAVTNTSPEESSRKAADGTIKLVTPDTIVLDILVKLTAFIARISSAITQERASRLLGVWSDNRSQSLIPYVIVTLFSNRIIFKKAA